jgi:hypothetical protein
VKSRGVTVPETAIVLGTALMLLFGIIQLVFLVQTQTNATGAAFVGAHDAAVNGSASQTSAYSTAVQPAFPNVQSSEFTLAQTTHGTVLATVTKNGPGLAAILPGAPSTVSLNGFDEEPFTSSSPGPTSALAIQASLGNYCAGVGGACSVPGGTAHPMYLSQYDDPSNGFNGNNGQFGEWSCRYNLYTALVQGASSYFPSTMPTPGPQYDPSNASFGAGSGTDTNPSGKNQVTAPGNLNNQAELYYWDKHPELWGTEALC